MMKDSHDSGVVFGTDFSIRIRIFSALVFLVIAFSAAFWLLPTHRDTVTFVALAVTAAGTLGGTFYLAETIRDQNRQQKNAYAFSLMARWNSPDLFHARRSWLTVTEVFQRPGKDGGPEGVEALLSKTPTTEDERNAVHNIRHVLNFLEEIAVAVKFEHASEEMLKLFFDGIVERAYEAFASWIPEHRKTTGRPLIWEQFYWLHSRWTKK